MRTIQIWKRWLAVLALGFLLTGVLVESAIARPLRVLAGTTLIADVLRDLCPTGTEVRVIIPGGACPGHFDIKPGDLVLLQDADALVLHQWQEHMPSMRNLLGAAENDGLRALILPEERAPMTPEGQRELAWSACKALADLDPVHAGDYRARAEKRVLAVDSVERKLLARLAPVRAAHPAVLCSGMQSELAVWAGCKVVGVYGRPQDMTPSVLVKLMELGREHKVSLVVDNIQSGIGAGRSMAEELGAAQVDLTNFPGGIPDTPTWERAIRANVTRLLRVLGHCPGQEDG